MCVRVCVRACVCVPWYPKNAINYVIFLLCSIPYLIDNIWKCYILPFNMPYDSGKNKGQAFFWVQSAPKIYNSYKLGPFAPHPPHMYPRATGKTGNPVGILRLKILPALDLKKTWLTDTPLSFKTKWKYSGAKLQLEWIEIYTKNSFQAAVNRHLKSVSELSKTKFRHRLNFC